MIFLDFESKSLSQIFGPANLCRFRGTKILKSCHSKFILMQKLKNGLVIIFFSRKFSLPDKNISSLLTSRAESSSF